MGSVINKKRLKMRDKAYDNFMGGPSYEISPLVRLRSMAASSFFGEPQYYKGKKSHGLLSPYASETGKALGVWDKEYNEMRLSSPAKAMELAIDSALEYNPEATLEIAVKLRNEDNIRVTPQVILVRAANHVSVRGTGLVRKYAGDIVKRGDEPATCISYQLSAFGKPIPNSLKRALAGVMNGFDEYVVAKYKQNHLAVSMKDVVKLVHPNNPVFKKLINDEVKNTKTWEAMRSAEEEWEDIIPNMGHMALLRNLRNFLLNDVDTELYLDKLVGGVKYGKQLPFRYLSAYKELEKIPPKVGLAKVLRALDKCIEFSISNVPRLPGRSLVLTDNSGSAWGVGPGRMSSLRVAEIGNLMGVLTGRVSEEGVVAVFGDNLEYFAIKDNADIMETTNKLSKVGSQIGHRTENGIWFALDQAIKKEEHWDQIFVYSDMQAGHGGLYGINPPDVYRHKKGGTYIDVPKLVSEYRRKVNPNVKVFLVQIAGYEDTIIPEIYPNTFIIGGWSPGIIGYASKMSNIMNEEQ